MIKVNNNSSLNFEVTIYTPEFGEKEKSLGPLERLTLSDFFPDSSLGEVSSAGKLVRSYSIIVRCAGTVIKEEFDIQEEVYVALLGPVPRAKVYLEGVAYVLAMAHRFDHSLPINDSHVIKVADVMKKHFEGFEVNPTDIGLIFSTLVCYCWPPLLIGPDSAALLKSARMNQKQLWMALNVIFGEDLEYSSFLEGTEE